MLVYHSVRLSSVRVGIGSDRAEGQPATKQIAPPNLLRPLIYKIRDRTAGNQASPATSMILMVHVLELDILKNMSLLRKSVSSHGIITLTVKLCPRFVYFPHYFLLMKILFSPRTYGKNMVCIVKIKICTIFTKYGWQSFVKILPFLSSTIQAIRWEKSRNI